MSTYDDSSLFLYPSGYKASVLFAQKPMDANGQLAFTRSNDTATRVASNGLIERVRTNLILQSNTFSTTWTTTDVTLASGQAGYDATNNAWSIVEGTVNTQHRIVQAVSGLSSGTPYTFSFYVKAIGNRNCRLRVIGTATTHDIFFNLQNGTIQTSTAGTGVISSVGGGWYRCSVAANIDLSIANVYLNIVDASFNNVYAGNNTSGLLAQSAQLQTGDIATPYIATTSAAVSVGPLANICRIDYLGGGCGKLLLEPQRTNSALYSEQINNAAWGKLNVTVSANQAVGPDGTTSADLVYPTTTGVDRVIEQLPVAVIGQTWTSSFFVKASGFSWVLMYAPNLVTCWFNASTGVFGTIGAGATARVLGQVNGYWRISLTGTLASSNAYLYVGPANANGTTTATANGTNGILIWGCQLEQGAYATSYIPTLAASVTRGADSCSKTGISSLIGQTEGTMFLDVVAQVDTAESQDFSISDGTANNRASIRLNNSGLINAIGVFGGSVQFSMGTGAYVTGQRYKIALAYKLNDVVLYVNGVQSATDTSATISGTLSRVGFDVNTAGTQNVKSRVNQAIVFTTRLPNTELAALTTL